MPRKFDGVELQKGAEELRVRLLIGDDAAFEVGGEAHLALTAGEAAMLLDISGPHFMRLVKEKAILPRRIWKGMLLFAELDVKVLKAQRQQAGK